MIASGMALIVVGLLLVIAMKLLMADEDLIKTRILESVLKKKVVGFKKIYAIEDCLWYDGLYNIAIEIKTKNGRYWHFLVKHNKNGYSRYLGCEEKGNVARMLDICLDAAKNGDVYFDVPKQIVGMYKGYDRIVLFEKKLHWINYV